MLIIYRYALIWNKWYHYYRFPKFILNISNNKIKLMYDFLKTFMAVFRKWKIINFENKLKKKIIIHARRISNFLTRPLLDWRILHSKRRNSNALYMYDIRKLALHCLINSGDKLTSLLFGQILFVDIVLTNIIVIDLIHQWLLFDFRLNQN